VPIFEQTHRPPTARIKNGIDYRNNARASCGPSSQKRIIITNIVTTHKAVERLSEAGSSAATLQYDAYGQPVMTPTASKEREARILIPTGASGAMIGKGGSIIKSLSEKSGCFIKLSDPIEGFDTKERVLAIRANNIASLVLVSQ
jgi:KH domain